MVRRLFTGVLFLLPVALLLPHLLDFPFLRGAAFSDLAVSHYPNGIYLQRAVLEWGSIPLWSPTILSGYPFAANPLSGLYYLPGLLAVVFPLPFGFNLLTVLHLVWGGIGMYRLLRLEGLEHGPALFGGLVFESMPKLFAHLGAGHLTLLYAVSWTPWLMLGEQKACRRSGARWFLPGMLLGVISLADLRWALLAGLFWLAYRVRCSLSQPSVGARRDQIARWLASLLANLLLAFMLSAPVSLPLLEYARLSTRSLLIPAENLVLSLPFSGLLGLFVPGIGGEVEWVLYPGMTVLALAIYAVSMPMIRSRAGFWIGALLAALLFSLGSHLPGMELAFRLPGMDLVRVPARALFLGGFCFSVLAAFGASGLLSALAGREWAARDPSAQILFAAASFYLMLAASAWFLLQPGIARLRLTWAAAFFAASVVVVYLARSRKVTRTGLVVGITMIALLDLTGSNANFLEFRPADAVLSEATEPVAYILSVENASPYRIYSPSYSIPQQVAARHSLELANGVDPLQLRSYAEFLRDASNVPQDGYSVMLPPLATGAPDVDNQPYLPDANLLGLLNVRYVIAEYDLPVRDLSLLARFGQTRVYQNQRERPRAWVQSSGSAVGENIVSIPEVSGTPDEISLEVRGPGLLVLSEVDYPGWQAEIDGRAVRIIKTAGLLRALEVPAGSHQVRFWFDPLTVRVGLILGMVGWVVVLFFALRMKKRNG